MEMSEYPHCSLIDLRPVKPVGDVEMALKAKSKDLAQEELLFKILSKPMVPLHRMIIPALELANCALTNAAAASESRPADMSGAFDSICVPSVSQATESTVAGASI